MYHPIPSRGRYALGPSKSMTGTATLNHYCNPLEIIPVGGTKDVKRVVALFGSKVGKLPISLLGLPLGAPHKSCGVRDIIEERFKRKLSA